jgi:hypothetical protein
MQHGIIVSSPLAEDENGEKALISPILDEDLLRFWALYWDDIVWPWCLGMDLHADRSQSDAWILHGLVRIEHTPTSPWYAGRSEADTADFMARIVDRAYEHLQYHEPGRWGIASGSGTRGHNSDRLDRVGGLALTLFDALPAPGRSVQLHDILQFKERYHSELIELRNQIDLVALEIMQSPDRSFAEVVKGRAFAKSIADVTKSARSSPLDFKLMDLNVSFNVPQAMMAGVVTYYGTGSGAYAIAAAAVGGGMSAKVGPSLKLKSSKSDGSPFQYAARVKAHLS